MFNLKSFSQRSLWNKNKYFRVDELDAHLVDQTGTLLLPMKREELLRYLPCNAKVAEIGVARGKFSSLIKSITKPSFLALVDPWIEQDPETYKRDGNNVAQKNQDKRYKSVRNKFESTKSGRECKVIRKFSEEAVHEFSEKSLDWIYIDGNHSYDACLNDLHSWSSKVTDDGFICGHDFVHQNGKKDIFGVVEAVDKFIKDTNFVLAAITIEHFPTYVITKNPSGSSIKRFRRLMFGNQPHIIQIHNLFDSKFEQARILDNGISRSSFASFDFTK